MVKIIEKVKRDENEIENRDLRPETSPSALPAFFSISSNFTVWLNKVVGKEEDIFTNVYILIGKC